MWPLGAGKLHNRMLKVHQIQTVCIITTYISVNTTAGISIIQYTGNGVYLGCNKIGHGLGARPNMILQNKQDGSENWLVFE